MFGYVRPVREELKCKDFDLYRATYCGLCRELRRKYGLLAPMFLNFDFTFLALLLWPAEQRFVPCRGRCHANPLARKEMCPADPALEAAADESIILTCPSIDRTADTFARILQAAAPPSEDRSRDRALEQLLYHLGRWIYLIDARDDLEEDRASGCYNPVRARYGEGGDDQALALTLEHSLNLARSAFCVPDFGCRTPVLENILYLGLPMIQQAVFDGSWSRLKKEKIWRKPT